MHRFLTFSFFLGKSKTVLVQLAINPMSEEGFNEKNILKNFLKSEFGNLTFSLYEKSKQN